MPSHIYPTEGRIKQKLRLSKLKEQGLKPKKIQKHTEEGNDDCGDDISGLGPDVLYLAADTILEGSDEESDVEDWFITFPQSTIESDVFKIVSQVTIKVEKSTLWNSVQAKHESLPLCSSEDLPRAVPSILYAELT